MSQQVYDIVVSQYGRNLKALRGILIKAREFAVQRKFDENSFLSLKAAPDMFPLVKQVQITTDMAKAGAAKLAGRTPMVIEDNETTLEQLIARVDRVIGYLNEFKASDFGNYLDQKHTSSWRPGMYMKGKDFFEAHNMPNFYFHLTATYMLLRSHGVEIGKKDFLGEQNWIKE